MSSIGFLIAWMPEKFYALKTEKGASGGMNEKRIAVYYEHPEWFKPLFFELDRRRVSYEKLFAPDYYYDPSVRKSPYALIINRISAYPSGGAHPEIVLYVKQFLAYLESIRANVINGFFSYMVATSKALQISFFKKLNLRFPKSMVIHNKNQAMAAASDLTFPVMFKPNIGGSGVGIQFFSGPASLDKAVADDMLPFGIDHTAVIQEYLPPKDNSIFRVEILDDEFLYAIQIPIVSNNFNYCPADGCQATKQKSKIKSFTPSADIINNVKQLLSVSHTDLGGVEYLINESDDQVYYFDINPLSNFVADAPDIVGFDPVERFVDYIVQRAEL
jgi:glutathione synthase/RimK-type ligase-like ATP-grasp enzyme